jgi:hypothetical protein
MASQALLTFFATLNRSSLGVISNNPGNLVSNKWTQSLPGYRSMNKEGFAVFATPADGIDALQLNLHSYEAQGVNTPFKIASMWAPAGQAGNDPIAYAETIAKTVGVGPYTMINLGDQTTLDAVTRGIMMQENGLAAKARFEMSVNPKVSMYLNIAYLILAAIGTGALSLSGIVDAQQATQIVAVAGLLAGVLNIVLHADSSSVPGPLAPPDPKVVLAAQAVADLPKSASQATINETKAAATAAVTAHIP